MSPRCRRIRQAALAALGLGLLLPPIARADWLVLRDRSVLETRGPWKLRGRAVVFTDRSGKLVSLRLEDVDLEASRAATAAALRPPPPPAPPPEPPPPPPRRQATVVITDADIGSARPEASTRHADVLLFVTAGCTQCEETKKLLDRLGVGYRSLDILRDRAAWADYVRRTGQGTVRVPFTVIGGRSTFGFSEAWIRESLHDTEWGARQLLRELRRSLSGAREEAAAGGRPTPPAQPEAGSEDADSSRTEWEPEVLEPEDPPPEDPPPPGLGRWCR